MNASLYSESTEPSSPAPSEIYPPPNQFTYFMHQGSPYGYAPPPHLASFPGLSREGEGKAWGLLHVHGQVTRKSGNLDSSKHSVT